MELHKVVYDLLFVEQCVIVPELGGFITRESPAGINTFTNQIKPKTKTVFFNAHMLYDDGLLLNYICEQEKISFEQAKENVALKVKGIKDLLEQTNKVSFGEVGEIIKNNEGNLVLIVNKNLNLDKSTFGLESIDLKSFALPKTKPVIVEEQKEVIAVGQEILNERRSYKWIPIAASFILLMVFGTLFMTGVFDKKDNLALVEPIQQEEQAAGVLDTNEEMEVEENEEFVDQIEGDEAVVEDYLEESSEVYTEPEEMNTVHKEELNSSEVENLNPTEAKFLVVLGSFLSEENAQRYSRILANKEIETTLYKKGNSSLNRIVYKGFDSKEEAEALVNTLMNDLQVNAIVFDN